MSKKKFDLIVFDWDGTLMDSTASIAQSIQAAARDLGLPVPSADKVAYVIGLSLQAAIETVFPNIDPTFYPKMVDRYRYHFLTTDHELILFPGVREMLADLRKQDYFLAVATGKSRAGLNRAMQATNLVSSFDATRCADESYSKPHPAMLEELTRELGQSMDRTLIIGDTTHDLQMAINAGAAGIAVEFGAHNAASLQQLSPIYSAKSIVELHDWLNLYA